MPTKKSILNFAVEEELLERIDDFRFEGVFNTRSEAIRHLIERALKDYENQPPKRD